MTWTYAWAAGGHAGQPRYDQFHEGCWIGCGPVAWAQIFGWVDRQAAVGHPTWAGYWGIYRQSGGYGADVVAPISMDDGVRNVIRELNRHVGTFCMFDSGATYPWTMGEAWRYMLGRSYIGLETHWNSVGVHEGWLKDWAVTSIRSRATPAIIGTGWLSHYPVAYGYALERRVVRNCFFWCWDTVTYHEWFYVNQGWGGYGNEWIAASTWFAGSVTG